MREGVFVQRRPSTEALPTSSGKVWCQQHSSQVPQKNTYGKFSIRLITGAKLKKERTISLARPFAVAFNLDEIAPF